jgi:hypothetical protein
LIPSVSCCLLFYINKYVTFQINSRPQRDSNPHLSDLESVMLTVKHYRVIFDNMYLILKLFLRENLNLYAGRFFAHSIRLLLRFQGIILSIFCCDLARTRTQLSFSLTIHPCVNCTDSDIPLTTRYSLVLLALIPNPFLSPVIQAILLHNVFGRANSWAV